MAVTPQPSHDFNVLIAEDPGTGSAPTSGSYASFRTWASTFSLSGGERSNSSTFVTSLDSPVVMTGKRNALTATISLIYTSGTDAAEQDFDKLRGWFDDQTALWVKYMPESGDTTRYYVAGPGYITNVPAPSGDASSADPLRVDVGFILTADSYTKPAS